MGSQAMLKSQLEVSSTLIGGLRTSPGFPEVSKAERDALLETIAFVDLDQQELVSAIEAVRKLGLLPQDKMLVVKALSEKMSGSRKTLAPASASVPTFSPPPAVVPPLCVDAPRGPGKLQHFEAIVNYWPNEVWDAMSSGVADPAVEFAIKLGLRSGSENTFKTIALAIMASSDGAETTLQQPRAATVSFCNSVKVWVAQAAKLAGNPEVWISKLMQHPAELRAHFPSVYSKAYADNLEPVKNRIPLTTWEHLKNTSHCRKDKSECALQPSTQWQQMGLLMTNQLKTMQSQITQMQSGSFNHRFTDRSALPAILDRPERGTSERLPNGSTMVINAPKESGLGADAAKAVVPSTAPAASEPIANAASSARMSVTDATAAILAGLAKPKRKRDAEADNGSDDEDDDEDKPAAPTKKGCKAKKKAKKPTKGKKGVGDVILVRYEDKPGDKFFGCFWRKMMVRTIKYKSAATRKSAERDAKDPL